MNADTRSGLGRSVFSFFVVQAAITALFGLLNAGYSHGAASRAIALAGAVLCLGVGVLLNSRPSPITWMVAVGFEIAFIVVGVGVFAAWHTYQVGTIVAIGNLARLYRLRAAFSAGGPGEPAPGPGYGQPYPGQQPYSGEPPYAGQRPHPGPQPYSGQQPYFGEQLPGQQTDPAAPWPPPAPDPGVPS